MSGEPFTPNEHRTGLVMRHPFEAGLADLILPRLDPQEEDKYEYHIYNRGDAMTSRDPKVGRKGEVAEVEFTSTKQTGLAVDYALDTPVPRRDQKIGMSAGLSRLDRLSLMLSELLAVHREVRVSTLVMDATAYPAGNKSTLSGTSQWSDKTNGVSDPIDDLQIAINATVIRANSMAMSQDVFDQLSTHPKIVAAINPSGASSGIAKRQAIADLFEVSNLHVGLTRRNTAKPGLTQTISRVWPKYCLVYYNAPLVQESADNMVTFGWTYQCGPRWSGDYFDPKRGARGSDVLRVAESVNEHLTSVECGYLLSDVIA